MLKRSLEHDLGAAGGHVFLLAGASDGALEWQVFPDRDKGRKGLARRYHGRLGDVLPELLAAQAEGCGVFVAVNATDGQGRRKENVNACRAMFLDLDGAPLPEAWPVPPTLVVQSSNVGGIFRYQCWWEIVPSKDFEAWVSVQKQLARRYGGDEKCVLLTQVGRLAGFWHQKDPDPPGR
jgi:hypothetical protein